MAIFHGTSWATSRYKNKNRNKNKKCVTCTYYIASPAQFLVALACF